MTETSSPMAVGRPLIFISNDDSISAPGLHRLVDYVKDLGDVVVVAPEDPHSGMSSAFTVTDALRINQCEDYNGARMFTVNGTPVDCVKLGLYAVVPRKPDIMIAGINHGSNSGNSIIYSGTMGAVLEACMEGIPSVGFSLLHHSIAADFSLSAKFVTEIVSKVLDEGLPKGICLNVNIPSKVVPAGIKTCRAARGHWSDGYSRYLDPMGNPFYMLNGVFINEDKDATDTDEYWLARNFISVVPVSPEMTYSPAIKDLSRRFDCED
ncbi:MAG: 5'/3'-nucleotidase SurE [Muribaculaceae bacterium]|nr:5'/3'-nucleotidase SurE [Muribaculaceae bacterium]